MTNSGMSDLISRAAAIDAIVSVTVFPDADYIKNLCENPSNSEDWLGGVCEAINVVEEINAVDAVPVVRCRDCKHSIENAKHIDVACERSYDPDFYCAAGERKDSE